jgi:hypothetical protein
MIVVHNIRTQVMAEKHSTRKSSERWLHVQYIVSFSKIKLHITQAQNTKLAFQRIDPRETRKKNQQTLLYLREIKEKVKLQELL